MLRLLFYRFSATNRFSDKEIQEYNKIYQEAFNQDGSIKYDSSYPKHRFLQYLSFNKQMLFHGSNYKEIAEFYPRRQTLYNGEYEDAVFSTSDGIWPIFYAVFNRSKLIGNFRNGCIESKNNDRFYFFSLSLETINNKPWTDGIVYIFSRDTFNKVGKGLVTFDEWISKEPVKPLLKLEVGIRDFIFYNKVSIHRSQEPLIMTWILYKFRTEFLSRSKRAGNSR